MKLRKNFSDRKEKKNGFTLVELIVVLVILAILAAIMVPTLIGWIDKAKEKQAVLRANNLYKAAQAVASEWYAEGKEISDDTNIASKFGDDVFELAGIPITNDPYKCENLQIIIDDYTIVGICYFRMYDSSALYWTKDSGWTTDYSILSEFDPSSYISITNLPTSSN